MEVLPEGGVSGNVETSCTLAVSTFNDGASSLSEVAKRLGVTPAPFSTSFLSHRDKLTETCNQQEKGQRRNQSYEEEAEENPQGVCRQTQGKGRCSI